VLSGVLEIEEELRRGAL